MAAEADELTAEALSKKLEAEATRELVSHVAGGHCASIAKVVVGGANPEVILTDPDECERLGVHTGSTLLHVAARQRHLSACKLLIGLKVPMFRPDDLGLMPITYAVIADDVKIVEALLDAAVTLEEVRVSAAERLAKQRTSQWDRETYRAFLLENRFLFHRHPDHSVEECFPAFEHIGDGASLLHVACAFGAHEALCSLVASRVNIDATDSFERTPLLTAASAGRYEPLLLLTHSGANLHAVDYHGKSAMGAAAEGGHTEVCEVLASMRAARLVGSRGIELKLDK
jgi:ankyrin repeat protein